MRVLKFGGTSVGHAEAFAQVASIVERTIAEDPQTVVVTSAMSGVTNALIAAARAAAAGDEQKYRDVRTELLVKHQVVAGQLISDGVARAALGRLFEERLVMFERLCQSIAILGELTKRGLDVVSGLGERLSAPLLAAVLRTRNIPAEAVDAGEIIVTDDHFGSANPLMDITRERVRARLLPLIEGGIVPVVTGFVGATQDGIATTLGRGGSDYSAAIIGSCLDADRVEIWTDVDGVFTADPRIVPEARTLPQLSYTEAAELAYFGAKVLHPKTILPAIEKDIPIHVLNTFNPDHPGTRIVRQTDNQGGSVKAITAIKDLTMITVEGRGMIGVPGIAARTFQAVASVGANVLMISQSSSEQNICFVIPKADAPRVLNALHEALSHELERQHIDSIQGQDGIVIVAVVGSAMKGTPGIAAKVFGALGEAGINVIAIAQGASEANISLVAAQGDGDEAVRRIHAAFELDKG
ncbi:MAG: aspartate kinase [Anaerolineae bacterium]|nr:aspartate kinase [Anaerolineae bacterium]